MPQNPSNPNHSLTNHVLIYQHPSTDSISKKISKTNIYLPAYLRAKIKNIASIDLTSLTSSFNIDLIYDLYFGGLFQSNDKVLTKYKTTILKLFENNFKFTFSRGDPVLLAHFVNNDQNLQIKVTIKQQEKLIKFTVRKVLSMHINPKIWLSPFQLLNSVLQVTVHPLTFKPSKRLQYTFRINLMNHPNSDIKLSFSKKQIQFGQYQLAINYTRSAYVNRKIERASQIGISQEQKQKIKEKKQRERRNSTNNSYLNSQLKDSHFDVDKDIKSFQYCYFKLPLYKHPFDTIVTVLVPIWLLGIINLGIFFQDQNLNDRLGSIITLVIALITYIPTIESAIPPTPNLVMTKLMLYIQIAAVICTFVHSMRVRNETNFRLDWKNTPEYWIAFFMLAVSAATVFVLIIIHYALWKHLYNNPRFFTKLISQKKESIPDQEQKQTSLEELNNTDEVIVSIKEDQWSNDQCDKYFQKYFNFPESSFYDSSGCIILNLKDQYNTKKFESKQDKQPQNKITCFPLVSFKRQIISKNSFFQKKLFEVKEINLYLPGYLRFKFKNFNSLDFHNLSGELNATMIFTVYYGGIFQYLKNQFQLTSKGQKQILNKLKNQFVLLFDTDQALQLTQGKMEYQEENKSKPQAKTKRNIDLTIKEQPQKKSLQFTIRRIFKIHLSSHVFLTPLQKLKTSIGFSFNSIKISKKETSISKPITINVNLMDTTSVPAKISISQVKKYCRYGLILPQLDIGYYNSRQDAKVEFQRFWDKDSYLEKRKARIKEQKKQKRLLNDIKMVFNDKKYAVFRDEYKKIIDSNSKIREKVKKNGLNVDQTDEKQNKIVEKHSKSKLRNFDEKIQYKPFKYASIIIPLYKYPFDSIAIIFSPLWLLALFNLGIYFQTENFGERVISIATLFIAFVWLIPIIRSRIPPNPSVTLIEYLVAALMFTCFLTLGHSMSVRFENKYDFTDYWSNGWFLTTLVITLTTVGLVIVMLMYHYIVLQPKYKQEQPSDEKFSREKWFNQRCQAYIKNQCDYEEIRVESNKGDSGNKNDIIYLIQLKKDQGKGQYISSKSIKSDNNPTEEHSNQDQGYMSKLLKFIFGDNPTQKAQTPDKKQRSGSSATLRELNNEI